MLDGLECAEAGLGAVPGEEDDLHGPGIGEGEVEPEEASDEGEGGPRGEGVAPVFDLVGAVGLHAAVAEDAVRGGHVEEGAGGDGDREKNCYLYALLDDGFWGQIDSFTQRWWRFGEV